MTRRFASYVMLLAFIVLNGCGANQTAEVDPPTNNDQPPTGSVVSTLPATPPEEVSQPAGLPSETETDPSAASPSEEIDEPIDDATAQIFKYYYKTANEDKIVELLKHPNVRVRVAAAEKISYLSDEAQAKTMPSLPALLSDNHTDVRAATFETLSSLKSLDAALLNDLLKFAADPNDEHRSQAIEAIGKVDQAAKSALPQLIKWLQDEDVQMSAAKAIGDIGNDAASAAPQLLPLLKGYSTRGFAADALVRIDRVDLLLKAIDESLDPALMLESLALKNPTTDRIVNTLVKYSHSEQSDLREEAILALGKAHPVGKESLTAIGLALKSTDKKDRQHAAEALQFAEPKSAVGTVLLLAAMQDPDDSVRRRVTGALAGYPLNNRKAIEGLLKIAVEDDFESHTALQIVLRESSQTVIPILLEIVNDDQAADPIRAMSAFLLARSVDAELEQHQSIQANLIALAKDEKTPPLLNSYIAVAYFNNRGLHPDWFNATLAGLKQQEMGYLREEIAFCINEHVKLTSSQRAQLVDQLIVNLNDAHLGASAHAIVALGYLQDEKAVPALIEVVKSPKRKNDILITRTEAAIGALSIIGPKAESAIPFLVSQLKTCPAFLADDYAVAIVEIVSGTDVDREPIIKELVDAFHNVPARDGQSLGGAEVGDIAIAITELNKEPSSDLVNEIIELLNSENEYLMLSGVKAVTIIGPPAKAALPRLRELKQSNGENVAKRINDAIHAIESR